jgi:3-isopropylmalate dehydratase small subunit
MSNSQSHTTYRPMTLTQKILYAHAINPPRKGLQSGDLVRIKVDWTIASELAWNGMDQTYSALGRPKIHNEERFYLAVDHTVDPITLIEDPRAQKLTQLSRDFAQEVGLAHFYDANETILHTKFYRDLVQPGQIVLGADSHTSSHGGVGAFAIGLGGADVTVAMVLGESWIEVPEAIAVEYVGRIPFGFTGKDVILKTLGDLGRNTVAMERSVEYRGELDQFTPDMRFTIANMTAEFGGLNGIFEADEQIASWLKRRPRSQGEAIYYRADEGAEYLDTYQIDLSTLEPQLAQPFSPDNVRALSEVKGMHLDGAFIGACTTTEEELVLGALVLEQAMANGEKPVASDKRLVIPGDLSIVETMRNAGLTDIYERAGFKVGVPGCSMCLGIASEKASDGEVWITSQNRNYQNRMGAGSLAWLASASTVAASALSLTAQDPRPWLAKVDQDRFRRILDQADSVPVEVMYQEPKSLVESTSQETSSEGERKASNVDHTIIESKLQRFGDHIDTDAIIPGEFCHLTDLQELGSHCFHYVAPGFADRVQAGASILVGGEGWGSGSSREHAVWALKGAGVRLIIAKSYAFIHKRNLVNEALPYLQLDDADFYKLALDGAVLKADLKSGEVWIGDRKFQADPPTSMVRKLGEEGGIVPAILNHQERVFAHLAQD